jgi:hypothetical protein
MSDEMFDDIVTINLVKKELLLFRSQQQKQQTQNSK